jgi:hypothetical protein
LSLDERVGIGVVEDEKQIIESFSKLKNTIEGIELDT